VKVFAIYVQTESRMTNSPEPTAWMWAMWNECIILSLQAEEKQILWET